MIIAALAAAGPAVAGPAISRIEDLDLGDLIGTVSAASGRSESILLSPATVTVIDEERIRLSGARSVPELLRTVPGIIVSQHAPGEYQVYVRGVGILDENNVVILLDGVPMNRRVDSGMDWSSLPVSVWDLERVEVVRGPVSVLYGSNAYTGVISLITRDASSGTASGRFGARAGTDRTFSGAAEVNAAAGRSRERGGWHVSALGKQDGTNSDIADGGEHPATFNVSQMLKVRRELGETTFTARSGMSVSRSSGLDRLVRTPIAHDTRSFYAQAELSRALSPTVSASNWLRTYHNDIEVPAADPVGFTYAGTVDDGTIGGGALDWSPAEWLFLRLGCRGGIAHVGGPYLDDSRYEALGPHFGGFVLLDLDPTDWLRLSMGSRIDISQQLTEPQSPQRVSLLGHWGSGSVRLTWSRAFREPSVVELAALPSSGAMIGGSPGLAAPEISGLELGVILAPTSRLTSQFTAYSQYASEEISYCEEPGERCVFTNHEVGSPGMGTELELSYALSHEITVNALGGSSYGLSTDAPGAAVALWETRGINGALGVYGVVPSGRVEFGSWLSWRNPQSLFVGVNHHEEEEVTIPSHWRQTARAAVAPLPEAPLWLALTAEAVVGLDGVELVMPGAAGVGPRLFLELRYEPRPKTSLEDLL